MKSSLARKSERANNSAIKPLQTASKLPKKLLSSQNNASLCTDFSSEMVVNLLALLQTWSEPPKLEPVPESRLWEHPARGTHSWRATGKHRADLGPDTPQRTSGMTPRPDHPAAQAGSLVHVPEPWSASRPRHTAPPASISIHFVEPTTAHPSRILRN